MINFDFSELDSVWLSYAITVISIGTIHMHIQLCTINLILGIIQLALSFHFKQQVATMMLKGVSSIHNAIITPNYLNSLYPSAPVTITSIHILIASGEGATRK